MWPARPEVDCVDGVASGLRAHETERDGDIVTTRLGFDRVQGFERNYFRALDARSGRGPQAQLKLACIHVRENVRAEVPPDQEDPGADDQQVTGQRDPAQSPYAPHHAPVFVARPVKDGRLSIRLVSAAQEPHREYGD